MLHLPSPLGGHCKMRANTTPAGVGSVASTKPVGRALQGLLPQPIEPLACRCIYQARWEGTARRRPGVRGPARGRLHLPSPLGGHCKTRTASAIPQCRGGCIYQARWEGTASSIPMSPPSHAMLLHLPSPLGGHCKRGGRGRVAGRCAVASTKPVGRALQGHLQSAPGHRQLVSHLPSPLGGHCKSVRMLSLQSTRVSVASTKPAERALQGFPAGLMREWTLP